MLPREGWYPSECRLAHLCYRCGDQSECPDSLRKGVHPEQMSMTFEEEEHHVELPSMPKRG
jgi:hypothetical protein